MYLSSVLLPKTSTFPPIYLCYSIICPEDTGAVPVEFHMKYSLDRSSRATKKAERTFWSFRKHVYRKHSQSGTVVSLHVTILGFAEE